MCSYCAIIYRFGVIWWEWKINILCLISKECLLQHFCFQIPWTDGQTLLFDRATRKRKIYSGLRWVMPCPKRRLRLQLRLDQRVYQCWRIGRRARSSRSCSRSRCFEHGLMLFNSFQLYTYFILIAQKCSSLLMHYLGQKVRLQDLLS